MKKSKYMPYKDLIVNQTIPATKIAQLIGNGCTREAIYAARRRFTNPTREYANKKRWREKNPEKERALAKKYRHPFCKTAFNNKTPWTDYEKEFILSSKMTTVEIAHHIGRTVGAVYTMQCRLRKQLKENGDI